MIREGQIWVRQLDENYLPNDTWKVKVTNVNRNGVTYRVIEYNGERADGVQIVAPPISFKQNYYLERAQRG